MSDHQHRKKMHHYNTPEHAHELTFSTYRRKPYLNDPVACTMLLEDIEKSRKIYNFRLWAYVLMPNHVHILIWPLDNDYNIGKIESGMKGIMSKRYRKYLLENASDKYESFLIKNGKEKEFIFWQRGGDSIEIYGMPKPFMMQLTILKPIRFVLDLLLHLSSGNGHQHSQEYIIPELSQMFFQCRSRCQILNINV